MSTLSQRSFSGGELSPSLYSRVDTVKYTTGLRTCRNTFVKKDGGATNRSGTTYVAEVSDSTKVVRLIPFIFNSDQTYVLEFGDQYMRAIRNGAQIVESAKVISNVTQANPAVVTTGTHSYSNGDEVFINAVGGMTELNNRNFKIANKTATTFELQFMNGDNVDSTSFAAYTTGGTSQKVFEITTPYLEADLSTLNFVQSADIITIVHPTYAPRELARSGHTTWTLTTITFAPGIAAPANPTSTDVGTGGDTYVITTIAEDTLEESLPSAETETATVATSGSPDTISWDVVSGAQEYNVYKESNGIFGLIGVAGGLTFIDNGIEADTLETPPITRNPFSGSNNFPSAVAYIQQRLSFANTNNDPEKTFMSQSGKFKNFTIRSPLQADDSVTFTMVGRQVNEVRHLLDIGKMISFTSGGEWSIDGDQAGIIRPTDINLRQFGYNGSSELRPLVIGSTALFVQARGTSIRDIGFDFEVDGYRGNDLTAFSGHLFENVTMVDWDYQQIPNSIIWVVRSDGVLLGLTHIREQQIVAWHRHDFGGDVENVVVIPNGDEDSVYIVVKRTINGSDLRYIERLTTRSIPDIVDGIFMDSSLSIDGRNTNTSHTMTLSGGTTWDHTETLTLTSSTGFFVAGDAGNEIHITSSDDILIRFEITGFTSTTIVTGKAHKTVPTTLRGIAEATWTKAVDELSGLWHIEGEDVSVFGDGFVVASPNNDAYDTLTVTDGAITLDKPFGVIHVGLPYISDVETLDIDSTSGETIADKKKIVSKVSMFVRDTRGLWSGATPPSDDTVDPLEDLIELKIRSTEIYDQPVSLKTEVVDINIKPEWNSNGRVFIRQVDPVPFSILSILPSGRYPFKGGS